MSAERTGASRSVRTFPPIFALADFLSKPVLGGFIVGLAISIAVGQLDKLLGYEVEGVNLVPDLLVLLANFGQTQWPTTSVGVAILAGLFLIDRHRHAGSACG